MPKRNFSGTNKNKSSKKEEKPESGRLRKLFGKEQFQYILVFVFVFILYGNTIKNEYALDDNYVVYNNEQVQKGISAVPEIFTSRYSVGKDQTFGYRPLAKASFAVEYDLFGDNPHISHFFNVLFYAISCLVLLVVLKLIFFRLNPVFSFLVCLLFIAHPMHTEVVASLKNREEIFSFLFSISSLYFFIKYFNKRRIFHLIFGIIAFVMALISKMNAITFLAIVPLSLYYIANPQNIFERREDQVRISKNKLPFILGGLLLYVLILINGNPKFILFLFLFLIVVTMITERSIKKGIHTILRNSVVSSIAFSSLFLVFLKLIHVFSVFDNGSGSYLVIAGVPVLSFFLWIIQIVLKKQPIGWKVRIPGYTIYLLAIIVVLGIIAYAAVEGPERFVEPTQKKLFSYENPLHFSDDIVLKIETVAHSLWFYLQKLVVPFQHGYYYGYNYFSFNSEVSVFVVFSLLVNLALLIYSIVRIRKRDVFAFAILFYFLSISIYANIYIPVNGIVAERFIFIASLGFCIALVYGLFKLLKIPVNAGERFNSSARTKMSIPVILILIIYSAGTVNRNKDWKDFLTLYNADIENLEKSAKANSIISGQYLFEYSLIRQSTNVNQKKIDYLNNVIKYGEQAVSIFPDYYENWNNVGSAYFILQNYPKAMQYLKRAYEINPMSENNNYNLAQTFERLNLPDSAIVYYRKTLEIDSMYIKAHSDLAKVYVTQNNDSAAFDVISKAIRLFPDSDLPYLNMGTMYFMKRDSINTTKYFEIAIEKQPRNGKVLEYLVKYFSLTGNTQKRDYYYNLAVEYRNNPEKE